MGRLSLIYRKNSMVKFLLFLLLFSSCGEEKKLQEDSEESKKLIDCKAIDTLGIYGNQTCTKMYCRILSAECTYKNGEKKKVGLVCLALKNPDGSYSCPKAYDCAIAATPEYDEHQSSFTKNKNTATVETFFNSTCEEVSPSS